MSRDSVFRQRISEAIGYHREQVHRFQADYHRGAAEELSRMLELYDATHEPKPRWLTATASLDYGQDGPECDFS